jgi:hypothetical protein
MASYPAESQLHPSLSGLLALSSFIEQLYHADVFYKDMKFVEVDPRMTSINIPIIDGPELETFELGKWRFHGFPIKYVISHINNQVYFINENSDQL